MATEKSAFKEKCKCAWNAVDYALWRFRKDMTWKRALYLLSPVLTAAVIFGCVMIPSMRGDCGEMTEYSIRGTTMYVEGFGNMENYYPGIHPPWWNWRKIIRRVVIEDGVESIGIAAFKDFSGLKRVEIADSVQTIQGSAFQNCRLLESVTANGVEFLGPEAFKACENLRGVRMGSCVSDNTTQIYEMAFQNCVSLETVVVENALCVEEKCFQGCTNLQEVSAERWLKIADLAFSGCKSLTAFPLEEVSNFLDVGDYVVNHDGVIIGQAVFKNCVSLREAALPAWCEEIPDSLFAGCTGLTSVTIPDGVLCIGEDAFRNCTEIESIVIPESVTEIHSSAFSGWTAEQTVYVYRDDLFAEGTFNSGAVIQVLE